MVRKRWHFNLPVPHRNRKYIQFNDAHDCNCFLESTSGGVRRDEESAEGGSGGVGPPARPPRAPLQRDRVPYVQVYVYIGHRRSLSFVWWWAWPWKCLSKNCLIFDDVTANKTCVLVIFQEWSGKVVISRGFTRENPACPVEDVVCIGDICGESHYFKWDSIDASHAEPVGCNRQQKCCNHFWHGPITGTALTHGARGYLLFSKSQGHFL